MGKESFKKMVKKTENVEAGTKLWTKTEMEKEQENLRER